MKKVIIGLLVACTFGLVACFEDDSKFSSVDVGAIEISGLKDTTMVSFIGNVLNIVPEIKTDYPESSLTYAWYLFESEDSDLENGYQENKIVETKELSYEINLTSGIYTLVCEVTSNENDYVSTSSLQLRAITSFSQGFYILKETVDGRTELDMYGQTGLSEDLLTGICGAPLAGKPSNLSITYDQCYIDEETQEMSGANMIHVFTDANEYRGFSSEDMKEVFNNETITFDGLTADEEPYTMVRGSFCIYFLSSEGVRGIYGSDFGMTSGRFGLTADGGIGASKFMLPVGGGMMVGYYYWNDIAHALYMTDYNAISVMPVMYDAGDVDESSLRCIACGVNVVGYMETDCFVCEDVNTGERYLYLIDGNTGQVTTPKKLDADLHLAQGDIVAVNGCSATYIYTVHENKVYAYNWNENSEFQVLLPGLPEDESIVYLSNQYLNISWGDTSTNFDNLIVATEIDGNYKLYFYDSLIGGIPTEEATVVEGTGRVKSVRYVSGVVSGSDFTMAFPGDLPIYPYTD